MPLRIGTEMPDLSGATEWLNGEAREKELIGSPTLIHFWSMSCYICKDNLSTLNAWKTAYEAHGLKVVAVHMPRSEGELDVERVKAALAEYGIKEPCAVDNEHTVGDRFETSGWWPYYFLFDAKGKMKARAAGKTGLIAVENALKKLIDISASISVCNSA